MSKERAQRRAERERLAAIEATARAAEQERRARRDARVATLSRWVPKRRTRPSGVIAARHRTRTRMLVVSVLALNVLVWIASGDWAARFLALALSVLIAPILIILMTS
ncbi:hypothetical protein ASC77_03200 [Nocardioides sp. Root1257]|uniref:hypothetical protein n=1 Tax=unclassified Nocardioides TaxID=2615069 RepID=UPI0006F83387|nr:MULTISPECIES: hypothetical protein [unclassified Nocardioides]KQW53309.1 hypothetical protein ASC77_03200 [Nocardioides sp. Root1257]KRC55995.1 hypothetical protein ASE24_03200 [Nocardioides sp. Root224]